MKNILKQILVISLLPIFLAGEAMAIPAKKPYGLGIPSSSGTGGAVRSGGNNLVIPLAPEDGGRTATERPTFYWYLSSSNDFPYKAIFELRDADEKLVYKSEGVAEKSGVYKLTLPAESAALAPEKIYTWQLKLRGSNASSNLQSISLIQLKPIDGDSKKAINGANTNLEKARLYGNYGYWFDALTSYTNQIESEPNNKPTSTERGEMMQEAIIPKGADQIAVISAKCLIDQINAASINEFSKPK